MFLTCKCASFHTLIALLNTSPASPYPPLSNTLLLPQSHEAVQKQPSSLEDFIHFCFNINTLGVSVFFSTECCIFGDCQKAASNILEDILGISFTRHHWSGQTTSQLVSPSCALGLACQSLSPSLPALGSILRSEGGKSW